MTPNERDNVVRWRAGRGGHVESFFLKLSDPHDARALWVKFTLLEYAGQGTETARAELWAIAFDANAKDGVRAAIKQSFPARDAAFASTSAGLRIGGAELRPGRCHGTVQSDGHKVAWDLTFRTEGNPFRPLQFERIHDAPLPSFKLTTPYPDTRCSGEVEIDGVRWEVDGWPAMQGHNWGKRHGVRYAWAHCNQFDNASEEDTFFEGFSGRIKLGPMTTPFLSRTHLRLGGVDYPFWSLRTVLNRRVEVDYHRWAFVSRAGDMQLEGEVVSVPGQTAALEYEDPDPAIKYCLNSKIARCTLRLYQRGRLLRALDSEHGAALEILVREPDHGLPIAISAR